jgi:hypothetical protein
MRYAQLSCVLVLALALASCAAKERAQGSSVAAEAVQRDAAPVAAPAGAPVYPGARESRAGDIARFVTRDPFDRVYRFYKQQMPVGSEKLNVRGGGAAMASFCVHDQQDFQQTSVTITGKSGGTDILITRDAFAASTEPKD